MTEGLRLNETPSPETSQGEVFLAGEADCWFKRNSDARSDEEREPAADISFLLKVLSPHRSCINSILEIGCCDGLKLHQLCRGLEAVGKGIDPSSDAVKSGNERFGPRGIELKAGLANRLPYEDKSFDLVYFGFCLYLVDRRDLFDSLNEAHRVLKPGGFLAITDFDPALPHARPYHHRPGVKSYKQDYAAALISPGYYQLAYKQSFSHSQDFFDTNSDERVSTSVLFKEVTNTGVTPINLGEL